ncbi:MAG TPA: chorismate-binding protein, partial [Bacteroidia bacterium]|nr:chorismate-binding protein [Bacteroidia bacterium]
MLQKFVIPITSKSVPIQLEALNNQFNPVCVFDSNPQSNDKTLINCSQLIAIGSTQELVIKKEGDALHRLQQFIDDSSGWLFGYLSYDLKNEIEALDSSNDDELEFPALHFFSPLLVVERMNDNLTVHFDDLHIQQEEVETIIKKITTPLSFAIDKNSRIVVQSKISKTQYMEAVNHLQQHIRKGDIYEVNFCQEFFAKNADMDTVGIYQKLNNISQAPFAAYGNFGDHQLICSSPE